MTRTFNWRIVFKTLGALQLIEAGFMLLPTLASWWYGDSDVREWLISSAAAWIGGLLGLLFGRRAERKVGEREGYVIVAMVWIVFSVFGMLPFYLSGALTSITDCWFETMAGFTTTGSTVIPDVEIMTHGILLWRSLMQWLGGMGIIVLSVAILPMFGLGGMQLYAAEVTGVSYEKLSPRIADTAKHMWLTYVLLTLTEGGLLYLFGMGGFDSLCHALSTISTGGFSTRNTSVMLDGPAIQWTIAVFMVLSAINFTQIIYLLRGKPSRLIEDEETRWYLGATVLSTIAVAGGLIYHYGGTNIELAIRHALFTVSAAITGTGFAACDYMTWPVVLWVMIFFMMFTGGASGSTTGGIKWVRIGIFAKSAVTELKRRIHPNAVIPVRFNGQGLSEQTTSNIMAFMFFYIAIIVVAVLIFCADGVSLEESFGVAVATIGNVGASIGQYGPSGNYADFPTISKWVMTLVMLIGRLEIFTILLLFTKVLWKK